MRAKCLCFHGDNSLKWLWVPPHWLLYRATPRPTTTRSRPIRLVIPYTAGAAGDQIGRPWAEQDGIAAGAVYVENIAGAGGALGSSVVAQSAPDGYSLLLGNGSAQVMIPLASARPAYDTVRDFRAIYRLITSTLAIAVHPSLPINGLQELAAYAKANPGKLSYGTRELAPAIILSARCSSSSRERRILSTFPIGAWGRRPMT